MTQFETTCATLRSTPASWLITGAAGFIGSNLVETLLRLGQNVVGLDNFITGHRHNIEQAVDQAGPGAATRFNFIEGDIRNPETCARACAKIDYVLHQAALGSVPRSIIDPLFTNDNNITGHLTMLTAAKDAGVKRFVYAASSSTYGDHPGLPKVEDAIGNPLSPYAVTKLVNELYADVFARCYNFKTIGLRYFNVFGPRQDPNGAYAAVIPKWFASLLASQPVLINGDGETSRDFCYIDNTIQANILAATAPDSAANQVYNIAFGARTTLNELYLLIRDRVAAIHPSAANAKPTYQDFRAGDVRHSLANISKAQTLLGYNPQFNVTQGLDLAADWYIKHLS